MAKKITALEELIDKLIPAFITALSAWMLFVVSNFLSRQQDHYRLLLSKLEELHLQLHNTAAVLDISRMSAEQLSSPLLMVQLHNDLLVRLNRVQAIMLLYFDDYIGLLDTLNPKVIDLGNKFLGAATGDNSFNEALKDVNLTVAQIYGFQEFLLVHKNEITRKHWYKYYLTKICKIRPI